MKRALLLALAAVPLLGAADPATDEPAIEHAMRAELARRTALALPSAPAPYYVGYWVVDMTERSVEGTLGAVVSDDTDSDRFVKVEVRVGSPESDNTNFAGTATDGDFMHDADLTAPRVAPLDDDPEALERELWLATDGAYKGAVETLERKQAAKRSEIATRQSVGCFSTEKPVTFVGKPLPPRKPGEDLASVARRVSAVFRSVPEAEKGDVHVLETRTRRRFVSSEGSHAVVDERFSGIEISCEGQARDGMPIERSAFLAAGEAGTLPVEKAEEEATRIGRELSLLAGASVMEDYSGPVLFEGRAAAEVLYELLGESLSGTPAKEGNEEMESPLARKLGKRVMPRGIAVYDDPSLLTFAGADLLGHYTLDDEGILPSRVSLVEDGRLVGFLMSRAPREGIARSNGHGRSGLVGFARGRVGNLVLAPKNGLTKAALREKLLESVRDEDLDYGLVVTELEPRASATSGEVMPAVQMAYRIDRSGKETLVRGATLAPMSIHDLRDVLGVGRDETVVSFLSESDGGTDTGMSVASPPLLFEDIEVNGPKTPNKRPPVVPRPPPPESGR